MAFKMKGNPYKMGKIATKSAMNMGKKSPMKAEGDPNKTDKPNDKSYLQKAYDKASQIGMGVRGVLSAMGDDEASQRRIYSGEDLDIGKAYRDARDKEKAHDDASPMKDTGHGLGNHGKHGSQYERKKTIRRMNEGDPRSQKPNAKKLAKKTAKAADKKAKASAANASLQRKYEANLASGKEFKQMSGKDKRETKSLGRKATRANKKANVAESVRKYEGNKVGNYMEKPKKKKKGGTLEHRGSLSGQKTRKFGDKVLKKDLGSGRKKESKENKEARKKDLKKYRQNKGLRGAINARRTGKGKDKI